MGLDAVGELLDADGACEIADRLATQVAQKPQHPVLREILHIGRFGIQRGLVVLVKHRRTDRHPGVDPAAGHDVDGRKVFCQPERVLEAEGDDRGADLYSIGALTGRSHDRDRRRDTRL
jgi:hypothetical protein